jgi:hypothetical protein
MDRIRGFVTARPAWMSVILLLVPHAIAFGWIGRGVWVATWIATSIGVLLWRRSAIAAAAGQAAAPLSRRGKAYIGGAAFLAVASLGAGALPTASPTQFAAVKRADARPVGQPRHDLRRPHGDPHPNRDADPERHPHRCADDHPGQRRGDSGRCRDEACGGGSHLCGHEAEHPKHRP